jgi:hypothetical protein
MTQCQCANPPGGTVTCGARQTAVCRVTNGVVDARCVDTPGTLARSLAGGISPHELEVLRNDAEFRQFVENLFDLPAGHRRYEFDEIVDVVLHSLSAVRMSPSSPDARQNASRHSFQYGEATVHFTVPHEIDEDPWLIPVESVEISQ